MARPRVLNDLEKIKLVVSEYKKDLKPTIASLCIALNCIPQTLYNAMLVGDDISDELEDAYNYLIYAHEKALWEKNPVPHIFYLKCIKRFGYQWKEQDNVVIETKHDNNINIKVIHADRTSS